MRHVASALVQTPRNEALKSLRRWVCASYEKWSVMDASKRLGGVGLPRANLYFFFHRALGPILARISMSGAEVEASTALL